jgi:hypothetical protein
MEFIQKLFSFCGSTLQCFVGLFPPVKAGKLPYQWGLTENQKKKKTKKKRKQSKTIN